MSMMQWWETGESSDWYWYESNLWDKIHSIKTATAINSHMASSFHESLAGACRALQAACASLACRETASVVDRLEAAFSAEFHQRQVLCPTSQPQHQSPRDLHLLISAPQQKFSSQVQDGISRKRLLRPINKYMIEIARRHYGEAPPRHKLVNVKVGIA